MTGLSRNVSLALIGVVGFLIATAPAAFAVLVEDPWGMGSGEVGLAAVQPADDGLRYLTRTERIDHRVPFEGFGWAGGRHLTVVRKAPLAPYVDAAAEAWDALPEVDVSVRTGDGCAWHALAEGEVGFCRVEVPYLMDNIWDGTIDVGVDEARGIHKARVRLNFYSTVLAEPDDLSVKLATHELGHAFGLRHPADEFACGSIMSYCFDRSDPSGHDLAAASERLRFPEAG